MRYVIESVPLVNQHTGQSNLRAMIDYYTRVISNNSGGFPYVDASLNPESDIMTLFREQVPYEGEETVSIHLYNNIPMQRRFFVSV